MSRELDHSETQADLTEGTTRDKTEQALQVADQILLLTSDLRRSLKEVAESLDKNSARGRLSLLLGGGGRPKKD